MKNKKTELPIPLDVWFKIKDKWATVNESEERPSVSLEIPVGGFEVEVDLENNSSVDIENIDEAFDIKHSIF